MIDDVNAWIERMVSEHTEMLVKFACSRLNAKYQNDAEQYVFDAFTATWEMAMRLGYIPKIKYERAYLKTIIANQIRSHFSKKSAKFNLGILSLSGVNNADVTMLSAEQGYLDIFEKEEEYRLLLSLISQLPERERLAVELRMGDLEYPVIAATMKTSEKNARNLYSLGKQRLEQLSRNAEGSGEHAQGRERVNAEAILYPTES